MSYLIRCDMCGKELAHDNSMNGAYRIEVSFEPNDFHMYTKHLCGDCLIDFERFLNISRQGETTDKSK